MRPLLPFALLALASTHLMGNQDWPQFRGPGGDGRSDSRNLPLTWSETENVKWKTPIPGEGWSSPVLEANRIWMQTALDDGKSLRAVSVDRDTGKILRDVEVFHVDAPEPKHAFNSHASPTPVLENGRVYISFGMYGVACLDSGTGDILWKNTELKHDHDKNGPGSSPILYKNLFILNCDGTELRYVAALDKATGRLAWKTERSNEINRVGEFKKAYSTPQIITVNGRDQLVSMGAFRVNAYEPLTGREIWWADIPGFSNVPRPLVDGENIYISTGFGKPEMWAIRASGTGDVTKTNVVWKMVKQAPAKPSPLLIDGQLFMISDDGGIGTLLDAKTGATLWQERLGGKYSASPLWAEGRIYCFGQDGDTIVLRPEDGGKVLCTNRLESGFMASPAVAGQALFLRTKTHLYRIEK